MSGWALVRERARLADTAVTAFAVLLSVTCLVPLFHTLRWVPPTVTVVLVIAVLGAASRALGMPLPLVPVVEALGLVFTITALTAASEAWAWILPTSSAWDVIGATLARGMQDSQHYGAPVPTWPGVVLLATGGVGLVALWADTLFVSVRSAALCGIGLAALYLAPAMMLADGAPWWAVAPPTAGWLLVLAADQRDRVRRWGGLAAGDRVRGLAPGAWRTGAVVIALATVVAVVLPLSFVSPWRSGGDGGPVASGPVILDPLVSMRRDLIKATDTEVLTYRTSAVSPSYLRVTALEDFDGVAWRQRAGLDTGRDDGIHLPVGVDDATTTTYPYDITIASLENTYLPLPYPLAAVSAVSDRGDGWRLDPTTGVAYSADVPATGLAYRAIAREPGIRVQQLREATAPTGGFPQQLALPKGISPLIGRLAREVTAAAQNPYDKAIALQRWFTREGGFRYSTDVRSGAGADYLAEFLTDRVGYCEQFAASMAVMARTLGIPSRVVVGFTQGTKDDAGVWHVTVRDAHAWPELWFEGVGWVRFEPTPRSDGTVQTPDYARTLGADLNDSLRSLDRRLNPGDDVVNPGAGAPSSGRRSLPWPAVLGVLALVTLLLAAVPMVRRRGRRWQRRHARGHAATVLGAWAELTDLAFDLGQPWPVGSTPRQAAERLSRGMSPAATAALRRLQQEVEAVRYARPVVDRSGGRTGAADADVVRRDLRVVERELLGRVRWQTRVTAYCWPPSERRRQRSSMRSMNPADFAGRADGEPVAAAAGSSTGRARNAE
jgi:transglutaminase-like putative cysteine protease